MKHKHSHVIFSPKSHLTSKDHTLMTQNGLVDISDIPKQIKDILLSPSDTNEILFNLLILVNRDNILISAWARVGIAIYFLYGIKDKEPNQELYQHQMGILRELANHPDIKPQGDFIFMLGKLKRDAIKAFGPNHPTTQTLSN